MRQNKLFLFLLSVLFSVGAMAQTATSLPYSTGFEDATDNTSWQFANATTNQWVIGAAAPKTGAKSLYISDDNGTSNSYNINQSTSSFAYRTFHFDAVDYVVSFDWIGRCESTWDAMQILVVPASVSLTGKDANSVTIGTLFAVGRGTADAAIISAGYYRLHCSTPHTSSNPWLFSEKTAWQSETQTLSIAEAGDYNVVLLFQNDGRGGNAPSITVDNLSIQKKACVDLSGVSVSNIECDAATIAWTAADAATGYEYVVIPSTDALDETQATSTTAATATITNLSFYTDYTAYVRAVCADGNGAWAKTTFRTQKACADLSGLTTSAISSDAVTLSWNATDNAISYDYVVLLATAALDENTQTQNTTSLTETISGLASNTEYTAYVRAVCAKGAGEWTTVNFHTDCAPLAIPFSENFDGTMPSGSNVVPYCWNKITTSPSYIRVEDDGYSAHSGDYDLYFWGGSSYSEQIAVLPVLTADVNLLQISLYYRNYYANNQNSKYPYFIVGAMSDPADKTTFVASDTLPQKTSWAQAKVYLSDMPDTHKYIAIKYAGGTLNTYGYIDDITVNYLPACVPAKNIHIGETTTTSAEIAWKAGKDETDWIVKYVAVGETDTVTSNVSGTPSLTISGLKHSTSYSYFVTVQSNCGSEKAEVTKATLSFATECAVFTAVRDSILLDFETYRNDQSFSDIPCWNTFVGKGSTTTTWAVQSGTAYKGAMAAYLNNLYDNSRSSVLVTPQLEIPGGSEVSMWVKSGYASASSADDSLIVYINANPTLEGATRLGKITELTSDYQFFRFSLETFRGNYYVLIESYSYGSVLVDNILISPEPACLPPTKLVLGDVAARQATFSWTPGKNETQWQIVAVNNSQTVYREETVDDTSSFTLDDLEPATTDTFSITINSLCSEVPSVEALTGTLVFTTICEPADYTTAAPGDTLLFTSFEADDENEAFSPDESAYWNADKHICWTNERVGGSSGYIWQVQQSSYRAHSGNQYLTIPNSSNDRPKVLFALPAMTFSAGQEIGLNFWLKGDSSDSLIVYVNSTASLEGATRVGCTGKLKSDYVHYEFDPIQTLEGVNYILLYIEHQISGDTYLDDIVVRMLPNCRKVKSAEITDIATTSAKLAWKKAHEENTWNVVVKNGKDTLLNTQATTPSVLIENLTPATKYTLDVTIAAVCDGVEAAEKYDGQLSFTTECEVISTFPWREGFESMPTGSSTSDGPLCWNILDANQGGNASVFVAYSYTPSSYGYNPPKACHTGSHGMVMALTSGRDAAAYALLPDMENAAGKQLVFWYKLYETSKKLEVGYLTDPADKSTWETIASYTPATSDTWEEIKVTLDVPEDVMNPHFGFRFAASYSNTAAYIDDIKVREVPVCDMATDLHVIDSLSTATTATVAWSGLADAGYTVIFRGNDTITKQATDTFCVLDGLTASRIYNYEVSVVARCAAGEAVDTLTANLQWLTDCAGAVTTFPYNVGFEEEEGYWYESSTVYTMPKCVVSEVCQGASDTRMIPSNANSTGVHSGNQYFYMYGAYSSSYYYRSSFAFPEMIIPEAEAYELAIWSRINRNNKPSYPDSVEVFYNAEKQSLDGATKIGAFKPTTTYTQYKFTLPAAGSQYVILKAWANQGQIFFDDASFRKIPTCFPVENVRVSAVGLDTARIAWDTNNDGASYRVTVLQGTNTLYNGMVNDTVLVLRNLNASSMYNNLQTTIVTVCTDGEESADIYTGTISFATECGTITNFPWVEDFEGFEKGIFSHPCWVNGHVSGVGDKLFAIDSNRDGNMTKCIQLQDMRGTTYTRLVLPAMDIPEAGAYDFYLDVNRHSGSSKPTEGVYIIAGTDTLGFVPRQIEVNGINVPKETEQGWYTYKFTIPNVGVQNITILGRSEFGSATNMDNFTVKANGKVPTALPATGAATDLAIKFISNGQVYILRNGIIYNALGQRVEVLK